jgi:adenylate cyclase
MGNIYIFQRQYEKAIAEGQRAISLGPNYADGYALLSQIMRYSGRFEESLELIKKAIRLSPIHRAFYTATLRSAYQTLERYEEAIQVSEQLIERWRRGECPPTWGYVGLILAYMSLGRDEEARAKAEELLRIVPTYSLEGIPKMNPFKDSAYLESVLNALRKAGLPETPPLPLPDKPSIAVLPFVNMTGDPEQEYISDGISEEIITALSKVPDMLVIDRHSTFSYKGKPVKVQQVCRELKVRYVLEGSVRKAGDQVRFTAQLFDGKSGHNLWGERYDRDLKDIFAVQDEITKNILMALQVKLTTGVEARVHAKSTDNLEAFLKYRQALYSIEHPTRKGLVQAQQLMEEAIALDSNYSDAYRQLGIIHFLKVQFGVSKSPQETLANAIKMAQKAITLDDSNALAYSSLGLLLLMRRQYDEAIAAGKRGYALMPNSAVATFLYAVILESAGRTKEALPLCKEAMKLQPIPTNSLLRIYALILRSAGRYEEAITLLKRAINKEPNDMMAHVLLTQCYWLSGRKEEARSEAAEVLRINPKFSLKRYEKGRPAKDRVKLKVRIDAMREAGLPD